MNIRFFLISILIFSLFLETTILSLPLVFVILLAGYILYPDTLTVVLGFAAGIVLDIMRLDTIGLTSIIFLLSFLVLELIKRAFELKDYRIILLLLFAASYIYASTFSYDNNMVWFGVIYLTIGLIIFYFGRHYKWLK